jgi:hypothetical protein
MFMQALQERRPAKVVGSDHFLGQWSVAWKAEKSWRSDGNEIGALTLAAK